MLLFPAFYDIKNKSGPMPQTREHVLLARQVNCYRQPARSISRLIDFLPKNSFHFHAKA